MPSLLLRSASLVTDAGDVVTDVLIRDGKIEKIGTGLQGDEVIDATGKLLFPGLIDCHVHFREPGLTHKATMKSEAASARAGGVTTVCEMPNTIPPTVTVAALADKVRRADALRQAQCDIDMRFFFGITEPAHLSALRVLWASGSDETERLKARCCGVKLFLDHSTGNQKIEGDLIEEVFTFCAEQKIPIVAHCEDAEMNAKALAANTDTDVAAHSRIRSPESEQKSVAFAIELVRKTGAHLHVAHTSTSLALELIREAKREKLPVTCEVAPHHLVLTVDDYASLGTLAKMNPPLRTVDHRDALWQGVMDGTVDCISTDHAPHTLEEKKTGDPLKVPSGVPGVETLLPILLSISAGRWPSPSSRPPEGLHFSNADILSLCFTNPNKIFNLGKRGIKEGAPADLVLVDTAKNWTINAKDLHSATGWTPFEGWKLLGQVESALS